MLLSRLACRLPGRLPPLQTRLLRPGHAHRLCSSSTSEDAADADPFVPVFRFPFMPALATLNRVKLYQTGLTVGVLVPLGLGQVWLGEVHPALGVAAVSLAGLASASLLLCGEVSTRVIGFMYYNQKDHTVKISHLSFYGRRRDVVVRADDIVPLLDSPADPAGLYWRVHFYEGRAIDADADADAKILKSLYMCTRFGGVKDEILLGRVFGENVAPADFDPAADDDHGVGGDKKQS